MKKRWNRMEKMTVCSFMAMMVMAGVSLGMTASAEEIIDSDETLAVQEMVPESENKDVLLAEPPAEQDTQEAGDAQETGIDITQIVVIEENLVPGAAQPELEADMPGEEQEAEAAEQENDAAAEEPGEDAEEPQEESAETAEAQEADEQEDAEEPEEEAAEAQEEVAQEEKTETSVSETITYEDSDVAVTVIASEEAQLPADTMIKVTRLEEGSEKYEEAKEAARQSIGAGENATYTFYDVTLESEGQVLDVEEGTVSVKMEFKTDAAKREVVKIEETESGKVARRI